MIDAVDIARPLTMLSEGVRLRAYKDAVGVWTIGYGHTRGVTAGMAITQVQAVAWLWDDLRVAQRSVRQLVKVPLTPQQEATLIDFVFNLGASAFAGSTLLDLLNTGRYREVPTQLARWNKGRVNGVMTALPGLTTRRKREADLWSTGKWTA